jgi:outer membrane protein TolC
MIDIPIETAGKRGRRRSFAAQLSEAARLNISSVAWQVRSNLRSSLLDLAVTGERVALLEKQFSVQQEISKVLDQEVLAGAISRSEALPYRIALERTRLDLADAQRLNAEARNRTAEAIGVPIQAFDAVQLSFDWRQTLSPALQLTSTEVRRAALQSRPDILSALADYAASEAALRLEIAKQYPDIHLQPTYQFDEGDSKWSIGFVFDLPIFNQNQGPIAEAQARRQEAAARFNALQAKVLADIQLAVAAFRITEKNASTFRTLADEQARRRDSVVAQFQAGAVDRFEVLNAELETATAQLVLLDGQTKLQQALGGLEDAVQRPIFGTAATAPNPGSNVLTPHTASK